jgi:hypothetical protein
MSSELKQAAQVCTNDAELKVVLLCASGRFFCAGGDIKEMLSHGDAIGDAVKSLADDLHSAISTFSRMQAALVVAVNGVAAGAGFSGVSQFYDGLYQGRPVPGREFELLPAAAGGFAQGTGIDADQPNPERRGSL